MDGPSAGSVVGPFPRPFLPTSRRSSAGFDIDVLLGYPARAMVAPAQAAAVFIGRGIDGDADAKLARPGILSLVIAMVFLVAARQRIEDAVRAFSLPRDT